MLVLREVPRSGVRLSAGLSAAETTTALAIAHTAAGGELPSAGWLLAIAATAYAASLVVLRGRAVRLVLPTMVGLQVVMHAWLVQLTSGGGLHPHGAGADALIGLSWPMLLAHLAAGAVAAVAWIVRRRAVDVLLGWSDVRSLPTPHRARVAGGRAAVALVGRDVVVGPTRGPPAWSFATA